MFEKDNIPYLSQSGYNERKIKKSTDEFTRC